MARTASCSTTRIPPWSPNGSATRYDSSRRACTSARSTGRKSDSSISASSSEVVTPQSQLTVVAPVEATRARGLRELLATLNTTPGNANPDNAVLPFGNVPTIHFARFSILTDATLGDLQAYDLPTPRHPVYLAFVVDCDGPAHRTLADLATRAGSGLRAVFSHCVGFDTETDLLAWMRDHDRPVAASYV